MRRLFALVTLFGALSGAASAHPEGAPWGGADPASGQNCASCHFDGDAVLEAHALSLIGLPNVVVAGETYALILDFAPSGAEIAGFMLTASAGVFHHASKGTEANEQDVRSTAPVPALEGASWEVTWTAPEKTKGEISFYAAVNGANEDMSAFGDRVYFKAFMATLAD